MPEQLGRLRLQKSYHHGITTLFLYRREPAERVSADGGAE